MYNVRKAKIKDFDKILELLSQVNLIHHNIRPDLFKVATKYTKEELEEIINDELKAILVAVDENDVVLGYSFCIFQQHLNDNILTDVKTLYLDDLCVDASTRGQNVGKALYEATLEFAKLNNCYNVTLNVWEGNDSAKKFYDKMGLTTLKTYLEVKVK